MRIIFFGSTNDSVIVLDKLFTVNRERITVNIVGVVTQPARPVGRKQIITPTPVDVWAKEHNIAVLSFESNKEKPWLYENEEQVVDTLQPLKADLIISACYGQKIPTETIRAAKYGGLNVHPSILPRWRGGDPVPWTILFGDRQAGVTVVTLEEQFDAGKIIAQKKINITDRELPDPLRKKLFEMGAETLMEILNEPEKRLHPPTLRRDRNDTTYIPRNDLVKEPYARRLKREDGFVPWKLLQSTIQQSDKVTIQQINKLTIFKKLVDNELPTTKHELALLIERMVRAFTPWPGVWTLWEFTVHGSPLRQGYEGQARFTEKRRLKIISAHTTTNFERRTTNLVLDKVQMEGKKPMTFGEFSKAYDLTSRL